MFGLDDFELETTGGLFGRMVLGAMLAVFALASALTTYGFFVSYAPGLGAVLHPDYGRYIAGLLGVLLFDLAGLGWTVLRSQNSDTTRQFVIATIAAVVTICLALLVSGLQIVLSSSFDVGLYTAGGALSDFGRAMQLTGVIVLTLGFVLNFAAIAAYVNTGKEAARAVQAAQLKAYVTAGKFAADKARAELVTKQTLEGVFRQLPDQAARAGKQNTADYLNATFGGGGNISTTAETGKGDEDEAVKPLSTYERELLIDLVEQFKRESNDPLAAGMPGDNGRRE